MNGGHLESMLEVPLQQGRVQQDTFCARDTQKLLHARYCLLSRMLSVHFHVLRDCFFQYGFHDQKRTEFTELLFQTIRGMNVDTKELKKLSTYYPMAQITDIPRMLDISLLIARYFLTREGKV